MNQIAIRNASKSYAATRALDAVDLDLTGGEVHALMGENGAGKSTLIKLLAGVQSADSMEARIDGSTVSIASAEDARAAGFRFIHQELNVVPHLSVAENILLGQALPQRFGIAINWTELKQRALDALARLGVHHINVTQQAARLSTGDQMLMKIAGSLVASRDNDACLYVFDEPTAALSDEESEKLFDVIGELKATGMSVLYVSHRMEEVLRICDRVTVLRDGKSVFSSSIADTDRKGIILAMTGREIADAYPARNIAIGKENSCSARAATTRGVAGLNFELQQGEILGVTGLADAGQSEVLQAVMGLAPLLSGTLEVQAKPVPATPHEAWAQGIAYVPKERRRDGLMLRRSITANVILPHLKTTSNRIGIANSSAEMRRTRELGKDVRLKASSLQQASYQLSGGNQQKVVFARALGAEPELLLLDEPTRGVDVGAKFDVYSLVRDLSHKGCSVIMTSSDLPELLGMCDRILILRDGAQSEIVDAKNLSPADLLARFYHQQAA